MVKSGAGELSFLLNSLHVGLLNLCSLVSVFSLSMILFTLSGAVHFV